MLRKLRAIRRRQALDVVNQEVEDIDNNNCAGVTTGVAVEMSLCFWQIRGKLCVDGFKPRLGVRSREARDYVIRGRFGKVQPQISTTESKHPFDTTVHTRYFRLASSQRPRTGG